MEARFLINRTIYVAQEAVLEFFAPLTAIARWFKRSEKDYTKKDELSFILSGIYNIDPVLLSQIMQRLDIPQTWVPKPWYFVGLRYIFAGFMTVSIPLSTIYYLDTYDHDIISIFLIFGVPALAIIFMASYIIIQRKNDSKYLSIKKELEALKELEQNVFPRQGTPDKELIEMIKNILKSTNSEYLIEPDKFIPLKENPKENPKKDKPMN